MRSCNLTSNRGVGRRRRRASAGFSIVEALIAAVVLGVGLMGIVRLHQSALRGLASSSAASYAMDIATQRAEFLAAMPAASLPACAYATWADPHGCRGATDQFSAPKGICSRWVSDGYVPMPDGTFPAAFSAATEAAAAAATLPYRMDEWIAPSPNRPNTRVIEVYVCWRDEAGQIRQVMTSRMDLNQ